MFLVFFVDICVTTIVCAAICIEHLSGISRVFPLVYFFERTRPAASMKPSCLIYLSNSNKVRPRERSDRGHFLPIGKKPLHTGVRTGCHYLISLYVSVSVCVAFVLLLIARAVRSRFPQTRHLWKWASVGDRVGCVSSHAVSKWSRSPGCC